MADKDNDVDEGSELTEDYFSVESYSSMKIRVGDMETKTPYSPEKALLLAIIERAVRDLSSTTKLAQEDKRSAIAWLEGALHNPAGNGITFAWAAEQLGFTQTQLLKIHKMVEDAKKDRLKKRRTRRQF